MSRTSFIQSEGIKVECDHSTFALCPRLLDWKVWRHLTVSNLSSYYVGVYDKRTNLTTIRPAPLHILSRQVKALKNLAPLETTTEERVQLRNKLGETFGTKKAKAAIRALERNRVDVDAMKGVASHLQDTIMENTGSLPTLGEWLYS